MHVPDRFPPELLSQPLAVKLAYVRQIAISHSLLMSICESIMPLLEDADPTKLLYLIGPTGVGKTVAIQRIENQLSEQAPRPHVSPTDAAGLLHVSLGTGEGVFSRNTYLHLVLRSLMAYLDTQQHPGGKKQRDEQVETKARVRSRWPRRMAEAYKEIVVQLQYHRPRAILLDDPQITCTTRRDVLAAHIDAISDVAVAIGIKH